MKPTETVKLTALVKAICPAQTINEYTPDVWHPILANVNYEDAVASLTNLGRIKHFIDPADIYAEVRRIRAERIRLHGDPIPPAGLTPAAELEWRRQAWRRIGDGEHVDGRGIDAVQQAAERKQLEGAA